MKNCNDCEKDSTGNDVCDYCLASLCFDCRWSHDIESCKKKSGGQKHQMEYGGFSCDCKVGETCKV